MLVPLGQELLLMVASFTELLLMLSLKPPKSAVIHILKHCLAGSIH
jgi:hypothetical protein